MTSKQDYRDYVDLYPDLVAAQQASGLSKAAFGERHWENHGKNNPNRISPDDAGDSESPANKPSSVKGANQAQKDKGNVFYGTNIPTKGYSADEIEDFNSRLRADINDGNMRGANDVIFSIAYADGGGQGNPKVGAVQSGVWKLNSGPRWAETAINSPNDEYRMRDDRGNLTGEVVRFSDSQGVMKGTPTVQSLSRGGTDFETLIGPEGLLSESDLTAGLTPTGEWGQNFRAGIVAGQPTYNVAGPTEWKVYGDDPGWETYFDSDPALGPARIQDPREGSPQYTGGANLGTGGGGIGSFGGGAYAPMAAQDWSGIMPQVVFAGSAVQPTQAMQGLVAGQGQQYQPWAMPDNSVAGSPFVSQNVQYTPPPNYTPAGPASTTPSGDTTSNDGPKYGPGGMYDNYHDWYMSDQNDFGHDWAMANAARSQGIVGDAANYINPLATLDLFNNPGFSTSSDEIYLGE